MTERVRNLFLGMDLRDIRSVNQMAKEKAGLNHFIASQWEAERLHSLVYGIGLKDARLRSREFGDFQTNGALTSSITAHISDIEPGFEFILEPTCGKGNFIIACLSSFDSIQKVVGIEIDPAYVLEAKLNILDHYMARPSNHLPDIDIYQANVFEFDFDKLSETTNILKTLIIGNPPWVTNAALSAMQSSNLPAKSNFKQHSGFEAITGKGNFDIGEWIVLDNCNREIIHTSSRIALTFLIIEQLKL